MLLWYIAIAGSVLSLKLVSAEDFLLVSVHGDGVYRVDTKSGARTGLPLPHANHPAGVTYDASTARVIWFDKRQSRVASAQFDGSDYRIHHTMSDDTFSMVYNENSQQLLYTEGLTLKTNQLGSNRSSTIWSKARTDGQIVYHPGSSTVFFVSTDNHVESVNIDGTGHMIVLTVQLSDGHMHGLTLDPSGQMLYTCGFTDGPVYTSHYFNYDLRSGVKTSLGSKDGVQCYRLATDGHSLFMDDPYNRLMLMAPLDNPGSSGALTSSFRSSIADMEYVNVTGDCAKAPTQKHSIRVADNTPAGAEVASLPFSRLTECTISGDKDAQAMFDVTTKNASCHVYLKAGQRFDTNNKTTYNVTFALKRYCPVITPELAVLTVEVDAGPVCQLLPESSAPGDVALEVPVGNAGQAMPLEVVLREDTRGEDAQFVIKSPVRSSEGKITATAQVVLKKKMDFENPMSRVHNFSVQMRYCVRVTGSNDHIPEFISPAKTEFIPWKEGEKGPVFTVKATDNDTGVFGTAGLRFYITYDPTEGYFAIDPTTGVLSTIKELDKESETPVIPIGVEVRDNEGNPPFQKALAVLKIKLLDTNDNKPIFTKRTYRVDIPDILHAGIPVLHVEATDKDEGANGDIVYSLVSVSSSSPFRIDPKTGLIEISGSLMGRAGIYSPTVTATDQGSPPLSASVPVTINVQILGSLPGRKRRQALQLPWSPAQKNCRVVTVCDGN